MTAHHDVLASVPIFANLSEQTLNRLSRLVVEREFPEGTEIVSEGQPGAGFFLISRGAVEVLRGPDRVPVATMKKGDFFGEMALLDERPRSATVRATEPTTCLVMTRWDVRAEVRQDPDLALELLEVMSRRIRDMDERFTHA